MQRWISSRRASNSDFIQGLGEIFIEVLKIINDTHWQCLFLEVDMSCINCPYIII